MEDSILRSMHVTEICLIKSECPRRFLNSILAVYADVVASDETSVRVMKKTCWEWVFVTAASVLHIIRPRRGAAVGAGAVRPRTAARVDLR